MQLHRILSGISFVGIMIGLAGVAGAIETGTGYITSAALIAVGAISGVWAGIESGSFRRRQKDVYGIRGMRFDRWNAGMGRKTTE